MLSTELRTVFSYFFKTLPFSTSMHDIPRDGNHRMQRALGQTDTSLRRRFPLLVLPMLGPRAAPIAKGHQTSQPETGL